jgi:NAD(P)-dependent dehydrogenase (short-subunit alcohol dehydrogenase family)
MGILEGKVAVVTGGAQGIGRGIVEALAKEGAAIVLVDVAGDLAVEAARQVEAHGVACRAVVGDVGLESTAEEACAVAGSEWGHLEILVNCAQSMVSGVAFADHSDMDFDLALSTGLWGTFRFMRRSLGLLTVNGGSIVNIVSSAGTHGLPGFAGYAAAKEGIRGLTKVAANEWGPLGVRVNAICPQASSPKSDAYFKLHPERLAEKLAQRPIKRDGDAEHDIGRTVVFLAGPDSTFITGATLMVNGGLTIMP